MESVIPEYQDLSSSNGDVLPCKLQTIVADEIETEMKNALLNLRNTQFEQAEIRLKYALDLVKYKFIELQEDRIQLFREQKKRCSEFEQILSTNSNLQEEVKKLKKLLGVKAVVKSSEDSEGNTTDDSDLSEVSEDPIHIGALLFANDVSLNTSPMIDRKVLKQPLQRKHAINTLRSRYSFSD